MYRYKLYCCNVHCCDSDLFLVKKNKKMVNLTGGKKRRKKGSEKPKGKSQAKLK